MPDVVLHEANGIKLMASEDHRSLYFAMDDYVADRCFDSHEDAARFLRDLRDRMAKRVLLSLFSDHLQSAPPQYPKLSATSTSAPASRR